MMKEIFDTKYNLAIMHTLSIIGFTKKPIIWKQGGANFEKLKVVKETTIYYTLDHEISRIPTIRPMQPSLTTTNRFSTNKACNERSSLSWKAIVYVSPLPS